jgi:glycosyltransferase involved in cell wall biosynthesis
MKIALVGPTYPFRGGISHYTTLLARHLRQRHEVRFFTFRRQYPAWLFPGRSDRDPSEEAAQLRAEAEPMLDSLNPLTWWRTARAIQAAQPEVLVLQWTVWFWGPLLLTLVALARRWSPTTRVVLLCHNATPHETGGRLVRLLAGWMQGRLARQSAAILCHSKADLAVLQGMAPKVRARAVMMPTFGALAQSAATLSQAEARRELGVSEEGPVLLFFGFVRPYKGLDVLFGAMPAVLARYPEATLLVAGEWWKDALPARDLLATLGIEQRVRLLDEYLPNDRLPALFAAADVAVLPYRSATQSAVVQLAFGFGLPVITTTVGGLPEAVQHEVSGLLVPPGDAEALAGAILRYLDEGWRERLTPGVEAARSRFSWEALVEAIEEAVAAVPYRVREGTP